MESVVNNDEEEEDDCTDQCELMNMINSWMNRLYSFCSCRLLPAAE